MEEKEQQTAEAKHSEQFIRMALDTSRHEKVYRPDGYGRNTGDCGDTVEIAITTMRNVIQRVSIQIDGCVNTNACANTVAMMVEGKPADEAWGMSPEKVIDYLETLPEDSHHCAELAVGALYFALMDLKRNPLAR